MKSPALRTAAVLSALLILTGCAASAPEATPSPSPSVSETAEAAPVIDDMAVCEAYMPTADGEHSRLTGRIVDMYESGNVTPTGVQDLYDRLMEQEAQSSPAILTEVRAVNAPIVNMQNAIEAGDTSFTNQWDAAGTITDLMAACADAGYRVDGASVDTAAFGATTTIEDVYERIGCDPMRDLIQGGNPGRQGMCEPFGGTLDYAAFFEAESETALATWLASGDLEVDGAVFADRNVAILAKDTRLAQRFESEGFEPVEAASSPTGFGSGTYRVGTDIEPGTYAVESASAFSGCYWERTDASGEIIDNNFINSGFRAEVTIASSDYSFHTERCGTWEKIG